MPRDQKRQPLLDALLRAFPRSLSPEDVAEYGGKNSSARVEELRRQGWLISTEIDDTTHLASYRLEEVAQLAPAVIHAGVTMRWDTRSGWTTRTHQEALKAGHIPAGVLAQAQAAAQAAYEAVVGPYLPSEETTGLEAFLALSGGDL